MVNYYVTKRNGKSIRLHKIIAEQKLGRPLNKNEIVHHINKNIRDNRPENLDIITVRAHNHIHKYIPRIEIKCGYCKKIIKIREKLYLWKKKQGIKNIYCSNRCSASSQRSEIEVIKLNELIMKGIKQNKLLYQIAKDNNLNKDIMYNHWRYMVKNNLIKESAKIISDKSRLKNGLYWCNRCKSYLPIENFGKNKSIKIGISSYCKTCRKLENKLE